VLYVPTKDTILEPGDEIFVFGKKQDIPKVLSVFN
jgi:trk system potassium uptake protein TrkA